MKRCTTNSMCDNVNDCEKGLGYCDNDGQCGCLELQCDTNHECYNMGCIRGQGYCDNGVCKCRNYK
ncbi:unnamed protein product [Thlaspi arvense]|uniref:Uncharacterized protein n=1 Tax=Thlaspi arvense TaxID=13288 RepID=A0AAU9RBC8_THLAR|nr:unnamed protein product [Thlaspi arvense]